MLIIVRWNGFQIEFSNVRLLIDGENGMNLSFGQSSICKEEKQVNERNVQFAPIDGFVFVPKGQKQLSSAPSVTSLHHPSRLGNFLRLRCTKEGNDADDEKKPFEIYSRAGMSCKVNDLREGN